MTALNLHSYTCLQQALQDSLERYASRTALIECDRDREKSRWSYEDLKHFSFGFAGNIQEYSGGNRTTVAILMSNQSRWIASAIGVFLSGCTLVPLDYKLTPKEQLALISHSESRMVVLEYAILERLHANDSEGILKNLVVFVTDRPEVAPSLSAIDWDRKSPKASNFVSVHREDVACIVYSSGTGGTPKGCMMTHGNYLAQAQALSELYPIGKNDAYFSFIPTNHAIDFMCGFLLPLMFGSKIVHQRTLRPEFFLPTIQKYKISHMAVVPLLLTTLEKNIRERLSTQSKTIQRFISILTKANAKLTKSSPNYFLSRLLLWPIHQSFGGRLRLIFAGGAFVESSVAQFFYDIGIPVVIGYGLTEAGTVVTVNDLQPFQADTVGKPLPITDVRIHGADESGVGEVWVKGPTLMKGYFRADHLTQESFENGWLKTGDLGKMKDGHLVLSGRKKNMIVTPGGKNVYPEDIESAFSSISDIDEYCVLASRLIWTSKSLTEDSMILVVKPKAQTPVEDLLQQVRSKNRMLSDYKRVTQMLVWQQPFHRTASMKIKRNELAQEISKFLGNSNSGVVNL